MKNRSDLLSMFDKNVSETRAALHGRTDGEFMEPWTLKNSGSTIFTAPKASVWRSFVMNHVIHHRAQLSVYLRMNDVPIPSMYGPSADEASLLVHVVPNVGSFVRHRLRTNGTTERSNDRTVRTARADPGRPVTVAVR